MKTIFCTGRAVSRKDGISSKEFFRIAILIALAAALFLLFGTSAVDTQAHAFSYDADSVYLVTDEQSFAALANYSSRDFSGKTIRLYCDIDTEGLNTVSFSGDFQGTFDGNGHTLYRCSANLFNNLSGTCSDVTFADARFASTAALVKGILYGTVSNVSFYGTHSSATNDGIVRMIANTGRMSGVNSFLTVTSSADDFSLICGGSNNFTGTVENCGFYGSVASTCATATTVSVFPTATAAESVKTCGAVFDVTSVADVTVKSLLPAMKDCFVYVENASSSTLTLSDECSTTFAKSSLCAEILSSGVAQLIVYDATAAQVASPTVSGLSSSLSSDFVCLGGYLPTVAFSSGKGTNAEPFSLQSVDDFYLTKALVRVDVPDTVYAVATDNIDWKNLSAVNALTVGALSVDGDGYRVYGTEATAASDLFDGASVNVSDLGLGFGDAYGYVAEQSTAAVTADGTYEGTGSASDPFVITSAGQWVAFVNSATDNVSGKTAYFGNDIILNRDGASGFRMGLSSATLSATVDGLGYSVYGLSDEPLVGTVASGATLQNIAVYAYGSEAVDGIVCTAASGKLFGLSVFGVADAEASFAKTLSGSAEQCVNYVASDYCIKTLSGTAKNCINYNSGCTFADTAVGCDDCFSVTASGYAYFDGTLTTDTACDNLVLTAKGYNTTTVYGYVVGETLPSLREARKSYRVENPLVIGKIEDYTGFTLENSSVVYGGMIDIADIEEDMTAGADSGWTTVWTYNGVTVDGTQIGNAGTYTVTFSFTDDSRYLPRADDAQTLIVGKATCSESAAFSVGTALTETLTYTASALSPTEPSATLSAQYGYGAPVYTYSATVLAVGTYTQTATLSSTNYKDKVLTRTITVQRASATLTVDDISVDYGTDFDASKCDFSWSLLGTDATKTKAELFSEASLSEYHTYFSTDYENPSPVAGSYSVTFNGGTSFLLKNYTVSVTAGNLTVNKVALPQGEISFYGATATVRGAHSATYTSEAVTLTATGVPTGLTVDYVGCSQTDAGIYAGSLSVYDANHTPLVLTVDWEITQAELTVTATDITENYGYEYYSSALSYSYSGLCKNDVADSILASAAITLSAPLTDGTVPNAGEYAITPTATGSLTNYSVTVVAGKLTVKKVSLTALYQNNIGGANTDFDDETLTYDGNAHGKTLTAFTSAQADVVYTYYNGNNIELSVSSVTDADTYTVKAAVTPKGEYAANYAKTEYTCTLTVDKKATEVYFTLPSYTFTYCPSDPIDYIADLTYCPVNTLSTKVPDGAELEILCTEYAVAVDARTYTIRLVYNGNGNYLSSYDESTLTILPFDAYVTPERTYSFSAKAVTPTVLSVEDGDGNAIEAFNTATLSYEYRQGAVEYPSVIAAGQYQVTVSCSDINYTLHVYTADKDAHPEYLIDDTSFVLTVDKMNLEVELGEIAYTYGQIGNYTDALTNRNYYIGTSSVKRFAYPVAALDGETVDIEFKLTEGVQKITAGVYTIENSFLYQPVNYNVTLKAGGTNRVTVAKKELSVTWFVDKEECLEPGVTFVYTAKNQKSRVTFSTVGYAEGETELTEGLYTAVSNKKEDYNENGVITNVGEYIVKIFCPSMNYSVDKNGSTLNVNVTKAALTVSIDKDIKVEEHEYIGVITYSHSLLQEEDIAAYNDNLSAMPGARFNWLCAYSPTSSPIGATYEIGLEAVCDNYLITVEKGLVTVIENRYPEYRLGSATYAYDGTKKSIELSLPEGFSATYTGNGKTDVGRYTVKASVTYPSGRKVDSEAVMTITQATPVLSATVYETAYQKGKEIEADVFAPKATVAGNEIAGTFSLEKKTLLPGENTYTVHFVPDDADNIKEGDVECTANAYEILGVMLKYAGSKYEWANNNNELRIFAEDTARVVISLDLTMASGIADGLTLQKNGETVLTAILAESEDVTLDILYQGEKVYSTSFTVTLVVEEEEETVELNETMLAEGDFEFNGNVIYVDAGGTRVKLSSKYQDDYELYVNGVLAEKGGYVLNYKAGETVTVEIRHKTVGYRFIKTFTMQELKDTDDGSVTDETKKSFFEQYKYYIIGAGAALVLIIIIAVAAKRR